MLTYGSIIKQNAEKFRTKPAVIFNGNTLSYQQLNERSNKIANTFLQRGYQKGDKVSVLMQNNDVYIEVMIALAKIGVVTVPINYRLKGEEIKYIVKDSDSRAFITTEEYEAQIASISSDLPQLDSILIVGEGTDSKFESYEAFVASGSAAEPEVDVHENDPLYIGYTSGTTGRPKGVVISHRNRVLMGMVSAYEYKVDESDVHIVAGPIYHAAPWIFLMMQLIAGGTLVIQKGFNAKEFLELVEKYKVTNTFLAPTMYNFIVHADDEVKNAYDIRSMRVLISAGSPLPTRTKNEILAFFKDVDLHEFYGSTESAVTLNIKPKDITRKDRCVGQPFPLVECMILDEDKKPVKQGEVGELYFKAPYLLDEYYKNEEATEEGFYNGFFSVGDMAMQDEEGYYYIVDRKKDMLISGGVNIYPREIEEVLYGHSDIVEAAVIGIPDEVWGESVKAIVVPREEGILTAEDVIAYCDEHLASYKKPKSVEFVKELPRNPSGKILKRELRDTYWEQSGSKI
ncbi:long-chain-fatty-acid--CoA ligase [Bacillus tianshenii]|nr:long-chain-fatty-acid--CoA ligase [Bacillus tianshenii]